MSSITFELPALFGDHHTTEVRRLLLGVPGVKEVYASSSFQVVEVEVEGKKVKKADLEAILEEAGYLGALGIAVESGAIEKKENGNSPSFRHSQFFEQTQNAISFAQEVKSTGRALWPCPGLGPIKLEKSEE